MTKYLQHFEVDVLVLKKMGLKLLSLFLISLFLNAIA